ncbi:MAG: HD domain-containing protein [Nitriliruptor sp.]|uniref:HD domain-containing protein n=1 Tax=Nitriliruptor sp. TaxID=2448056 RepID=UPI0034A000AE
MTPPRRTKLAHSLPGLVAVLVGSVAWLFGAPPEEPVAVHHLVLIVVAIAVTELLPIRPPRGRPVPTSTAVVAMGALIGVAAPMLALLTICGWGLARLRDRAAGAVANLVVSVSTAWVLAGLAAFGRSTGDPWRAAPGSGIELDLTAAVLVALVLVTVLPALQVLILGEETRFPLRRVADEIRATWTADVAIASTAVMGALVHRPLGPWTLPSMLIPLLAARIGLARFAGVTTAYDQTIRAMSRLPEQLGTVAAEHGVRVGSLARDVALELGADAASALEIEQAAYLHELGHIRLEPEDRPTRAELAEAGARVIASAGDLDRVAAIVRAHGDPAKVRRADAGIARAARIVVACCEVDRYEPDLTDGGQRHEVTVRLVREVEDLEVVRAVIEVAERRVRTSARR